MLRRLALVSILLVVPSGFRALAQDDATVVDESPPIEYTALIEEGLAESTAQRWLEARAMFRRAHAIYPNARTLRAIGMTSFELRDYPEAYRMLRAALESTRRPLTEAQRAEVEALLARTAPLVGRYSLDGFPRDAVIRVDGVEVAVDTTRELVLPTGDHRVEVRSSDTRATGAWTVQGGEQGPLPVSESADETNAPVVSREPLVRYVAIDSPDLRRARIAGWSLTAGGGALIAASAVLLGLGRRDIRAFEGAQAGTSWSSVADEYDRGPTFVRSGVALLPVGLATVAVGLPIALRHRPTRQRIVAGVRGTVPTLEVAW